MLNMAGVLGLSFLGWLWWWRAVSRLACLVACCFLPGFCGGEPSRADVACWGGWGPHTPCARQIGPRPPQPTPPSRHGSLRCVWGRRQKCGCHFVSRCVVCPLASFFYVTPNSGAGAHGIARARGEPSDNLCSQCAEDGSPLERAQSEAASARISRARQRHSILD